VRVFGGEREVANLIVDTGGTHLEYLNQDDRGSITGVIDEAGSLARSYTYSPYGRRYDAATGAPVPGGAAGHSVFGFGGNYHDSFQDLILMRGRAFHSPSASFLSPDPLARSLSSALALNPYVYAEGDPASSWDTNGFYCDGFCPQGPDGVLYGNHYGPGKVPYLVYMHTIAPSGGQVWKPDTFDSQGQRAAQSRPPPARRPARRRPDPGRLPDQNPHWLIETIIDTALGIQRPPGYRVGRIPRRGDRPPLTPVGQFYIGEVPVGEVQGGPSLFVIGGWVSNVRSNGYRLRSPAIISTYEAGVAWSSSQPNAGGNVVQWHHLNQTAAFRRIPQEVGISMLLETAQHDQFHRSMGTWWQQFRGPARPPTVAEYNIAAREALHAAGIRGATLNRTMQVIEAEQAAYNYKPTTAIRVPGR
jgi:RHS repeat-associated protein